jgi:DNA repair exonuclease SbcCD nuclease subunit
MDLDNRVEFDLGSDVFRVTFIGDCHFNNVTPKSRIDDYPQTCIDKLELLRVRMLERKSKVLVMVGDIFHKPKQPVEFLVRVIQEFNKFKKSGIRVFTIVGN